MNKVKRSIISMLVLALVVTFMIPTTCASAETNNVTDEQLEKVMNCYKNILATNPYEDMTGGFTAETFLLKDLDQDGVPELIINGEAAQIFSYDLKNDKEMFIYNSWVYNTMYYSSKTKTILYTYEWRGKKEWNFYKFNNTQENDSFDVMDSFTEYFYTDGKYDKDDFPKHKKGYYKGNSYSEKVKKTTKKAVDSAIKKYVPGKVKIVTNISNTEENRSKYLDSLEQFNSLRHTNSDFWKVTID